MADPLLFDAFIGHLTNSIGVDAVDLDQDTPLGRQLSVDSTRMIELAIVLEQEFGMDLPEDLDLRQAIPAELYRDYLAVTTAH